MEQLAERLVGNADFFLFSLLCGLVLAVAIILDNPAIYILAALLAPFMAPVVGLGFTTAVGSLRFFLQSLGSLLIGCVLVFVPALLGGWISKLIPNLQLTQAHYHVNFTVPDFILLTIGILLAIYITVKAPKNRSLVASVALAYEIYIPVGLAGFGLSSGFHGLFPQGLEIVGIWLAWVILSGTVFLMFLKIRPASIFGYLLTAVLLGAALYTLLTNSAFGAAIKSQMNPTQQTPQVTTATSTYLINSEAPSPSPTLTPAPEAIVTQPEPATPTNTLPPTNTPTETITPQPTPLYAKVFSTTPNAGVNIRKTPGGEYLMMLQSNTLVIVVDPNPVVVSGIAWIHIIVADTNQEGWISQGLLLTATPSAQW
jgi:uncharacterized membrane protein